MLLADAAAFGSPPDVTNLKPPIRNIMKNAMAAAGANNFIIFSITEIAWPIVAGAA